MTIVKDILKGIKRYQENELQLAKQLEAEGKEVLTRTWCHVIGSGEYNIQNDAELNAAKAVLFDELVEALDEALCTLNHHNNDYPYELTEKLEQATQLQQAIKESKEKVQED